MFGDLPTSILISHIMHALEPKDALSLAMTSKGLYHEFFGMYPTFRHDNYHSSYYIYKCLTHAIAFIDHGSCNSASWHFYIDKSISFSICKIRKNMIFGFNGVRVKCDQQVGLEWFRVHILPFWHELKLHIKCNLKKRQDQQRFLEITEKIHALLS